MKNLKNGTEQAGNFTRRYQDVLHVMLPRVLSIVLLICSGLLVSSSILAESLDQIPGPIKTAYAIEFGRGFDGLYDSPDAACAVIAERQNTRPNVKTRYTNPRGGNKPNFGLGCFFDIIDPPGSQPGTVYRDWFGQNWIITRVFCPEGYGRSTRYGGSPSYRYIECVHNPATPPPHWNQPNCGSVGNPVLPSNGVKIHTESDYRPALFDSIRFERFYRSSASWQVSSIGRLGHLWYDTYQRTINYTNNGNTSSLVLASAFRPDGRIILFSLAEGEWQPKADISDTLAEQKDASGQITGWKYTVAKDGSVENYNTLGMLTSITFRSGRQVFLEYANVSAPAKNQLISVTDSFGRQLHFAYDSMGRISTLTDPAGEIYSYAYDHNSNLISITYPDNTPTDDSDNDKRIYHYEDSRFQNALTGITDSNGERFATYAYDNQGRAILTEHAGGAERVELAYNSDGTTTVTDAQGKIQTYHFSILHSVYKTKKIDGGLCTVCGNQSQSTAYDANGNISSKTDFNGNVTNYTYNLNRNVEISRTEALGTFQERTTTTKWHVDFRLPTELDIFDKAGNHLKNTSFSYADTGLMLSRTETDIVLGTSRTTAQSYNELGLLATVNGSRTEVDDITVYSYNAQGDLIKTTNALNQETLITSHDPQGRPLILQTPNGLITELAYDARGRIISRTIDGQTTLFSYDSESNLISLSLPDGNALSYTYDAAHRMIGISNSLGNTITYTLDALGNHTKEEITDPAGMLTRTQSRIYNTFNQLIKTVGGEGQETDYGYDANGNLISHTDGLNQKTVWGFDALNRLTSTTDAASGITTYSYDSLDHLTQLIDPNDLTTNYTYNALGDLLQLDSPSTGTSSYTYDSAGNRLSQTDARSTTTYTYDALNRLTHISYPDTSLNVTYTYDENSNAQNGIGRLTGMIDASGTTEYRYDKRGNLIRISSDREGIEYSTHYSYTPTNHISQMTYPSGRTVNYFYNIAGQIDKVTTPDAQGNTLPLANNALYQPFGDITELEYGNGLSSLHSFDQDYRHNQITVNSVFDRNYTSDDADNISEIINNLDRDKDQIYSYDSLNQLLNVQTNSSNLSFLYDSLGNRTQASTDSSIETYHYSSDSQHLADINGNKLFSYDMSGNTVQLPHATIFSDLSYGDHNRLTQVNGVSYIYNGNGERVKKQLSNGTIIHYHYGLNGQLIAETDVSGNILIEYIYLNRLPIAMIVNANEDNADTDASGNATPNSPPILTHIDSQSGMLGEAISLSLIASDADADTLSYSARALPEGLSINAISGEISGSLDAEGSFQVTLIVDDSRGGSDSVTISWTVTDSGTANTLVAGFQADYSEGTPATGWHYLWNANGPLGQASNYVDLVWNGSFYDSDGIAGDPDTTSFAYGNISDTGGHPGNGTLNGESVDRAVIIAYDISQVGDYQIATSQLTSNGCQWGNGGQLSVFVNDAQISSQTYVQGASLNFDRPLGALDSNDTVYIATSPKGDAGCDGFIWDFALEITPPSNQAPSIISLGTLNHALGDSIALQINASDPENDVLDYVAWGLPAGLSINTSSGQISGTANTAGNYQSTIIADDGNGNSVAETFTWVITAGTGTVSTVATYQADYSGGTPTAGWRYLWNASGPVGQASGYTDLAWNGSFYDSDGIAGIPDATAFAYGNLGGTGGHPGQGTELGESNDRAVIIAYDISQTGNYQIAASQLSSIGCQWGTGGQVSVFVNDTQISSQTYALGSTINFDGSLGSLENSDTVYVAIGPDGDDGCDEFNLDFALTVGSGNQQRADTYFIHTDHLGTPVALTDIDQNIAWSADYAPFGRADVTAETVVFNLRFPGQYFDSETGLHYNYYRYYDPTTGRYITSDPIGLRGGLNTYVYVGGLIPMFMWGGIL